MVHSCCAYNCNSHSDHNKLNPEAKQIKFHTFPLKNTERLQKWMHAIKRKDFKATEYTRLCSRHFQESDYKLSVVGEKLVLKNDAIPTVFNYPDHLLPPKKSTRRVLQRISITEPEVQETSTQDDSLSSVSEIKTFADVAVLLYKLH